MGHIITRNSFRIVHTRRHTRMCVSEMAGLIKGAKCSTCLILLGKESYYASGQHLQNIRAPQVSTAVKERTDRIAG